MIQFLVGKDRTVSIPIYLFHDLINEFNRNFKLNSFKSCREFAEFRHKWILFNLAMIFDNSTGNYIIP